MTLSPSWEAANRSATQEFPQNFMEPEDSLQSSKILRLVPILSQINPAHITPSYLSNIIFNIEECRIL
jgi:hypothetical protein